MIAFLLILFLPPLSSPLKVTSGFGEWRELRLHAGVDFSTGGRVGVPVLAIDSGELARIKASYTGYGKALYLKLKDGTIVVYAHLARFTPSIDTFIYRLQKKQRNYFVDVGEGLNLHFKKGEVLGYSGQSGSGPPHLHFEVRKSWETPINPFQFVVVEDSLPPKMLKLKIIPFEDGIIDGLPATQIFSFKRTDGSFGLERIPEIYGKFRLEVEALDFQDGYTINPKKVMLFLDGEKVFELDLDSLDYRCLPIYSLIYDKDGGRFIRLYHMGDHIPPPYSLSIPYLILSPGLHRLKIVAIDFKGNSAIGEFFIEGALLKKYNAEREPEWDKVLLDGKLSFKFERDGLLMKVDTTFAVGGIYEGEEVLKSGGVVYYFIKKPVRISFGNNSPSLLLSFPITETKTCIKFENFELICDSSTFAEEMYIFLLKDKRGFEVFPKHPPIKKRIKVVIKGKEEVEGIFLNNGFAGKDTAIVGELGLFSTRVDTTPPKISILRRRGIITGKIEDDLTGVDPRSLNFYLDNDWIPVDFDIDNGTYRFIPLEPLRGGEHIFKVEARDGMGNYSVSSFKVYF